MARAVVRSRAATPRRAESWESLDQLVSIRGTPLLRGTPLCKVMRRFGELLDDSAGTALTYELSQPTASISEFISHTWSTSRFEKFFTLACHYNRAPATAAAWFTGAVFSSLTALGYLPVFTNHPNSPLSLSATISGNLVFIVVFFCAQDLLDLVSCIGLCRNRKVVFLDKVCIHQTDEQLKQQGIMSLAGFLQESERMIVVYSDHYLQRLWTVYELSSFLLLSQDSLRVKVLPTLWSWNYASTVVGLMVAAAVYVTVFLGMGGVPFTAWALTCLGVAGPLVLWVAYSLRRWFCHLSSVKEDIKTFCIREAACTVESDRDLVERNICSFLHCFSGKVEEEEEALDEFDRVVREDLPHSLLASFGQQGYPYNMMVAGAMTFVLFGLDQAAAEVRLGGPRVNILASLIYSLFATFALVPFAFFVMAQILGAKLHLRAAAEACYVALAALPCLLIWAPACYLYHLTLTRIDSALAWEACWSLIAYCTVLALGTLWIYLPRESQPTTTARILSVKAPCPTVAEVKKEG